LRKPILAGNWKMYKTGGEGVEFAKGLKDRVAGITDREIVVCPPFTGLVSVSAAIAGTNIKLGAQNMGWEEEGAFTGEVSAKMLKETGCTYVIIGHSERRQYFSETDETVNKRMRKALASGIIPIVCVGETLKQREEGATFAVVEAQVKKGLDGIGANEIAGLVIAYEPVWAIGTGKTASPRQAEEVHKFIRETIAAMSADASGKVRILYGGSIKPENIAELMKCENIDGGLVGGASLKADSFASIVRYDG